MKYGYKCYTNIRVFEVDVKQLPLYEGPGEGEPYDMILQRVLARLDWIIQNHPDLWEVRKRPFDMNAFEFFISFLLTILGAFTGAYFQVKYGIFQHRQIREE